MRRSQVEEAAGNWLIVLGAALLLTSLFLAWSHQLTPAIARDFGASPALQGVPTDPTGWQVYSAADVLLALLSAGLVVAAVHGSHVTRQVVAVAAALALVFVVHALASPPSNGIVLFNTIDNIPQPPPTSPEAGPGETMALIGLLCALAGLAVTLLADRAGRQGSTAAAPASGASRGASGGA